MATIQKRTRKDGQVSFRVLSRIGKKLTGETFSDEDEQVAAKAASDFAALVDRIGMAAARAVRDERSGRNAEQQKIPTVSEWMRRHVEGLTGITQGTRDEYDRMIRNHIDGTALGALPVDAVKKVHVRAWVRDLERGKPVLDRDGKPAVDEDGDVLVRKPAAKTIRNRHGLLSAAFDAATHEDPPLRDDNPCRGTRISETQQREMVFLTEREFNLLLSYVPERWRPMALTLVSTGCRFSEITALPVYSVHLDDDVPNIRVERSWKWISNGKSELGPPKTRKGRRTVYLGGPVVATLRAAINGKQHDELVFSTASGKRITRNNFHDLAWQPAVTAAVATHDADGNPKPVDRILTKRPRVHDLRHTYASWQIARGVALNIIRDQMGHESITTTVDLYSHLMPDAGRAAAAAMAMSLGEPEHPELEESLELVEEIEGEIVEDEG